MEILKDILSPIGKNLLGFDMLIFIFAIGTLCYYIIARKLANNIYKILRPQGFLPEDDDEKQIPIPSKKELVKMRERSFSYYTMFVNLTSIFPLLGILGTVLSLIPMVPNIDTMKHNFLVALTSTLWGLIFSIVFKILDGFLSPRIEDNIKTLDLYLTKKKKNKLEERP